MKSLFHALVAVFILQQPAQAQEAGIFGLGSNMEACLLIEEAENIANVAENRRYSNVCGTRSVRTLDEMQLLRDAYRADPEATLELIERILKAGKTN